MVDAVDEPVPLIDGQINAAETGGGWLMFALIAVMQTLNRERKGL